MRLRRRLLVFSAPVVVVILAVVLKLLSVAVAGNSAVSHFEDGNVAGLRSDVAVLRLFNVIEPDKLTFTEGGLAVLEGRLDEADARFSAALDNADAAHACRIQVNLELVRETQGDLAARDGRPEDAQDRYASALAVVGDTGVGCFAGNTDPDPERRVIREEAAARLAAKIDALRAPPPAAAPPPEAPAPPPPPPPPAVSGPGADSPRSPQRLDPTGGDPVERLQQLLEDAAG